MSDPEAERVVVSRPVPAFAPFADAFFTAGITGTNGKTSTTLLLGSVLRAGGFSVAAETTLGVGTDLDDLKRRPGDSFVQHMQTARAQGVTHLAVEVTSEALARGWAKKWRFDLGVFTNLSWDHLDAHGSFEHYLASKAQLFIHLGPGRVAVLNAADPASNLLHRVIPRDVRRCWYASPSRGAPQVTPDLAAREIHISPEGTTVTLEPSPQADLLGPTLETHLVGPVFGENTLAAAAAALAAGLDGSAVHAGLRGLRRIPGRFEVANRSPLVAVDYAHTPDALGRTCETARLLAAQTNGRVIVVFGAGGNRDVAKRVPMGEAVGGGADVAIVTNDNPRDEEPKVIASALESGCRRGGRAQVQVVYDRRTAIERALAIASTSDVVVVCGKGHESGQVIGSRTLSFDDAQAVRDIVG